LLTVTVYKKGAKAIKERLEADARTIEALQRQVAELTACFREQATQSPQPSLTESFNSPVWQPPQQLPLLAAKDTGSTASPHPTGPHRAGSAAVACFLPKSLVNGMKISYYGRKEV
jgi:hypothetical protein